MQCELFLLIDFTKIIVFGKIVGECGGKCGEKVSFTLFL